jgi:hypothetical protein
MLTPSEQATVMRLSKLLVTTTLRNRRKVKSGESTARMSAASIRLAEDRLRDFLKNVGRGAAPIRSKLNEPQ